MKMMRWTPYYAKIQGKITPILTRQDRQEQAARRLQPLGALDVRFDTHKSQKQQPNFFRVFGSQTLFEV